MKRFKKISEVMLASPIYTFSVVFLTLLIILSLVAPLIPIDPNATDVSNTGHLREFVSGCIIFRG